MASAAGLVAYRSRRLPVYVVVEVSDEMRGDSLAAATQAVRTLISELYNDPQALETAYLSVITFADEARQLCALSELSEFRLPAFVANGRSNLTAGLRHLADCIEREVTKPTSTVKGDWRPLAFLIGTGLPSPGWFEAAARITLDLRCSVVALQSRLHGGQSVFAEITQTLFPVHDLRPDLIRKFFKWTSASIGASSDPVEPSEAVTLVFERRGSDNDDAPSGTNTTLLDSIFLLVERSADLNARSNDGETPLHRAVRSGNCALAELLISRGAALDSADNEGNTPLLLAARLGARDITVLLIRSGADVDAKNSLGFTALHYAAEWAFDSTTSSSLPSPPPGVVVVP